jgi:DNA-3-methyladenine glycosylase I
MNKPSVTIRSTGPEDAPWILSFVKQEWGSDMMVTKGQIHHMADCKGLIAEKNNIPVGLLVYETKKKDMEIISLNAVKKYAGVGTGLLEKLTRIAKQNGIKKIWLVTTNDNLDALRFYQKRGFVMSAVYPNAIEKSRAIKPQIPLYGDYGIALRDEIELAKEVQ